jgi:hypothetical protein
VAAAVATGGAMRHKTSTAHSLRWVQRASRGDHGTSLRTLHAYRGLSVRESALRLTQLVCRSCFAATCRCACSKYRQQSLLSIQVAPNLILFT